jgi:hypothetical protein
MAARQVGHLTTSNGVTNASIANMTKNLSDQVAQYNIDTGGEFIGGVWRRRLTT